MATSATRLLWTLGPTISTAKLASVVVSGGSPRATTPPAGTPDSLADPDVVTNAGALTIGTPTG